MQKQIQFKIKGMQRDLSASAFNPEYAYENKNIRIMPTDESTLLSMVNEKGNRLANISGIGDSLKGTPIGQALIDDELIIFTAGDSSARTVDNITPTIETVDDIISEELTLDIDSDIEDRIYKLWFDGTTLTGTRLYRGQLDFDYRHPIETISFYENQEIKKIYWTDGLNQPRVINVAAASDVISRWNDNSFNFTRRLKLQETITIDRNVVANGTFSPGVIQYAFTYFDKYGQESNIFYVSPLYYISYNNRGANQEDKVGNSFTIKVLNADENFDYVRIYSIHRTSIDGVPTVKRVIDIAPVFSDNATSSYSYTRTVSLEDITVRQLITGKYVNLSDITPTSTSETYKSWTLPKETYNAIRFAGSQDWVEFTNKGAVARYYINDNSLQVAASSDNLVLHIYTAQCSYTDSGSTGDSIDPTELLYIGGEEVIFGTMAQKDNTLFLGDITLKRKIIDSTVRDYFKGKSITFTATSYDNKSIESPEPVGYYPYINQLSMNSYQFKTFKYLETYRLGVQFQHYTGKWSEPIWINDVRNTQHIQTQYTSKSKVWLPTAVFSISDLSIINRLISQGYIRVRPVVVYPSLTDRECICQGILCPTVFNVGDRYGNSPFAQSSWFTRPNAPFDEYKAFHYNQSSSGDWGSDWNDREEGLFNYTINSRAGVMSNNRVLLTIDGSEQKNMDVVNRGAWAEFRHMYPIPSNNNRNAEIQCIWNPPSRPTVSKDASDSDVAGWVSQNSENFYVDQSIVTLHSPDIEFDDNVRSIDTSGLKLRIVGIVPVTAFYGDIDIQTSTPPNNYYDSSEVAPGFYKEPINAENISRFGWKSLCSGAFWFDEISDYKKDTGNTHKYTTGFVVYPFHRNGSLNNKKWATDGYRPAMLDKKKISNTRYSYNSLYFEPNQIWKAYAENHPTLTGISGIVIFDSDEVSLVRVPAPKNSGLPDINYYGNVDKVLNISRIGDKKEGYPIMTTGVQNADTNAHLLFSSNYMQVDGRFTDQITGTDPVRMKYKSTPHAVLALNYTSDRCPKMLPTLKDSDSSYGTDPETWNINYQAFMVGDSNKFYWEPKRVSNRTYQDILTMYFSGINGSMNGLGPEYGWLWLGEIYNDNVLNRFGGQTEEAFENNQWVPCGDAVSLTDSKGMVKSYVEIKWVEGDTYYQRYDHLKTYPFTLEDQNAITDIISFMCETRVNIDGRYDRNRGQTSNFAVTPTNFNLINDVYSQQNNFFNYRTINPSKLNLDNFHNSITWTKTKTVGELVDTWTNITLASVLDLDGDKGDVRAIRRFNNNLIAFQDRGISQILYNESMQVASTEGVPIEIANSGKVTGKRYLTDKIGCANKWSMCETSNGIYFIDDTTKGIFLFNGKLYNLSDRLGFHSWINSRSTAINIWNPKDFNGFVTYYDKVNGDVFFISRDECLAFSEPLGQFTSFYSYEHLPYFVNLEDRGIAINKDSGGTTYKVWLHNEGDYNMFFNRYCPFYTTVIANPDMAVDKIFNNLEFRADSWKGTTLLNTTFDTLTTWNEYQTGTSTLNNILGRPSELKKKFRVWRANIPRASSNGRDRMRNPWLYVKLSMEGENTNKTILHDMIVHYFE
jgi:hypothetical protein|nr:MAG TPA: stabilization protein [Crassvirales sp.]